MAGELIGALSIDILIVFWFPDVVKGNLKFLHLLLVHYFARLVRGETVCSLKFVV